MAEMPVLVEDHTPRDERIPRERVHENGVTGIAAITIATDDVHRSRGWWSALLAQAGTDVERADLDAAGVRFDAGPHAIELLAPRAPDRPSGRLARRAGPVRPTPRR
jgi:hypothetical protein